MTSQALPTFEEVAAQAAIELLAMQLYKDERTDSQLQNIDRQPRWVELTTEDRNEYRKVATELLANEHTQPWDR